MTHWGPDDIPWADFRPERLDPGLLRLVKAAALVERNAGDYTTYLKTVFRAEPAFLAVADGWERDEVQHGEVLARYATLADPDFDFARRFRRFVEGYRIPLDRTDSVRGSLTGELLARCIVETGTSSMYSALRDATDEPVLRQICHRIAGDEFRHYKLFYTLLQVLAQRERPSLWRRVLVAAGRLNEADDDELSFAWFAANEPIGAAYDRAACARRYASGAFRHYRDAHAERAVNMVFKAVGLDPKGWLAGVAKRFAKRRLSALAAA